MNSRAGDIGLDPFYKLVFPTMDMLTQEHQDLLNAACDAGDPKQIKATVRSRRPVDLCPSHDAVAGFFSDFEAPRRSK